MIRLGRLLLAVGGVAMIAAASQPWWRAVTDSGTATLSGTDVAGGVGQALGAVVLVGVLLSWTLRRAGRRVVAAALAVVGVGAVLIGVRPARPTDQAVLDRLRQSTLADTWTLQQTPWTWLFALAGLAVGGGAVLLALGRSAGSAERFERSEEPDPGDVWKSLDAGVDPTAQPTRSRSGRQTRFPSGAAGGEE